MQENPDAFDIAASLDRERRSNRVLRGPLHGIPFTVKDNIATADLMETTAGSWALLGSRSHRDATVVERLREAGAVLLGKATMSEWADMRSSSYSEGYSPRGGQCRSPYNLTVNPGGSSSGSAVGVASNAIAFSVGTETDGSGESMHVYTYIYRDPTNTAKVINPAMRNQIVGFKPTVGLTSRAGVIPESENQDSVGTFGRTVRDAVIPLDVMRGPDQRDTRSLKQSSNLKLPDGGFAGLLSTKEVLKGANFGIPSYSFWNATDGETRSLLMHVVHVLMAHGANVHEMTELDRYKELVSPNGWDWDFDANPAPGGEKMSSYTYIKVDFFNNIRDYLKSLRSSPMKSLQDIVDYNKRYAGSEGGFPQTHPAFPSGQDGLEASLATGGVKDNRYYKALLFRKISARNAIDAALRNKGLQLDGLLVPLEPGQSYQVAAQAGYPMITLPIGVHEESGMGIGLGIMQSAWKDGELVKWGSAIEDLLSCTKWKRTPPEWRGMLERNLPVPL